MQVAAKKDTILFIWNKIRRICRFRPLLKGIQTSNFSDLLTSQLPRFWPILEESQVKIPDSRYVRLKLHSAVLPSNINVMQPSSFTSSNQSQFTQFPPFYFKMIIINIVTMHCFRSESLMQQYRCQSWTSEQKIKKWKLISNTTYPCFPLLGL